MHGTAASFTRVAPHELAHGTVFRTKWLNQVFLYLYSVLSWWDPFDYGTSHTYHHRYTLYPEGDRENLLPLNPKVGGPWFLIQLFTLNLTGRPGRTFVFHGAVAVYGIASGYWILPILVGVAPLIGNWLVYLVGLPQHCSLRDNVADFRKSTRSMKLDPITTFLYWRMNWHTEHHMYAGVPCYHLGQLAREIAHDMPAPRTLRGAWKEMRAIWNRQQSDPAYQFNTPLPNQATAPATAAAGAAAAAADRHPDDPQALAASIGELAPHGLRAAPESR